MKKVLAEAFGLAVQMTEDSVIVIDDTGKIIFVNDAACVNTGYSSEELIGESPAILRAKCTPLEYYEELWETVNTGEEWNGELLYKTKDGEEYWVFARIRRFSACGKTFYVSVQQTITHHKTVEEKLIEQYARIESLRYDC